MKKLYEGNIKKNFFVFALPLILTVFFSQAHSIIDTIMAGRLIGDHAISATGSTAPFVTLISSICWGYGTGFSVYAAVLYGKGDYSKMFNVIKVNFFLSSAAVVLFSALCIAFHEYIFDFLNIEAALRKEALAYFAIYMAGLIFLHINWCSVYILNAMGLTTLPFIASVASNILNIGGNYVLIKYAGLGVAGAALATVLSSFCIAVFYVIMILRTFKKTGVKLRGIYFDKEELSLSWSYALPTMLQQSVMYLCTALVSPLTNLCGANAIAGYTIGMRLYDVNAGVYQNSNKTVSNYIAQCIGAGKHSLIKKGIGIGLLQTILFLLPVLSFTVFGAEPISEIFLDDPAGIHYAKVFIQCCMPFVVFNVINNILHAVFRSTGAGRFLVIATVVYSISRFGYSYLLYERFEMYGIYAAIVLAWITEAVFGLIIYFSGRWKSAEYKLMEQAK